MFKKLFTILIVILAMSTFAIAQNSGSRNDTINLTEKQQEIADLVDKVKEEYYKKNYDQAIVLGQKALDLTIIENDLSSDITISSFIGNAFLQSDDTITSKKIFQDNVTKALRLDNPKKISTAQIDLANFYALQKKAEPAIKLYKQSIPFAEANQDTTSLFILHSNIAELSLDNKNVATAKTHVESMNKYVLALESPYFISGAKLINGRLFYMQDQADASIAQLKEGASIAEEIEFNEILIQIYDYLSKALGLAGRYEEAFGAREKYINYQNEQYEKDKIAAIESATAKFKLGQYQQQLKEQELQGKIELQETKRTTQLFWIKIAVGILLLFATYLIITYRRRLKLLKNLRIKNKLFLHEKEKTEKLSKAKSQLFSNMTHELRTPMYGIIGISNLLLKNDLPDSERGHVNTLKFSADYLLSLINNALYFNKTENDEKLISKNFNLKILVESVVESTRFLNTDHPNEYIIELDENLPEHLIGDDVKLSQVLMNLLSNSSKFTNDGVIVIRINQLGEVKNGEVCVSFTIEDNGIGIPVERQKEIFENFVQNIHTLGNIQGSGLGLPIVKKILKKHNSEIKLTSEEGDGTKIEFSIFYKIGNDFAKKINKGETLKNDILVNRKILIVDDNSINRMVTEREVTNYGASVVLAASGEEALKIFEKDSFDLILMDINMPGKDGFETSEQIRAVDKNIPILALTAVEKEKVLERHRFNLMNDIVIKPYKGEVFISKILKNLS